MINTKKKVVFILPLLCSGGAERALITLMNNLDTDLFTTEMIALDDSGPLKSWIKEGIPLHSLGGVRVGHAFFKLKRKIKDINPDIVMTTMAHSNFLLMSLKIFFPKKKFIIREAVVPSSILKEHKKRAYIIKFLYKTLYPKADRVISPSQDIINEFNTLINLKTNNHTVLYNQVDLAAISKSLNNISFPRCKENTIRFVCAGRLHYQKGYDRLIKSLADFSLKHPWKLVILGEGDERKTIENLIFEHGLNDKIELLGNIVEPWKIIAAADCLLLPSRWEGMPNVVLESLASGTPVIASSDASGVQEIYENCAAQTLLLADNMEEFTRLMSTISANNKKVPEPSFLPDAFRSEKIMKKFEDILLF